MYMCSAYMCGVLKVSDTV